MNIEYISGTLPPIIFFLPPYVSENNWLLNKNDWDDLDIIDQGHSDDNISKLFLYLGYPWTNFNKTLTTMMASMSATRKKRNVISSDLDNVGQGHHLHKLCISAIIRLIFTKVL